MSMVMRSMRDSAKWVMLILSLAFVGWLVLDWVEARGGTGAVGPNPVVARVAGHEIRSAEWNQFQQNQMALARESRGGSLTEEESRQVREAAWEQLVNQILIQAELERLGIDVTASEIRQAFLNRPPPEFVSHPAFQTDGSFDIQKYRQYFQTSAVDPNLLLQIEGYYRETLPREKLAQRLTAGVYVSEAEAWEYFRDLEETARVRFVSVDPAVEVPASAVQVTEAQVSAYYREHRDEFERPAQAVVHVVSLPIAPSGADSARARAHADSLRRVIASGERPFDDVAREASADSASAERGGDVGRLAREDLPPALQGPAFSLPVGRLSEPLESSSGLHLLRVEARAADTVSLRQILVPVELSRATEDSIFDRIDRLEGVALRSDLPTAADSLGLEVRAGLTLSEGAEFVPGAGALGVGVDWAFDAETRVGDLSPFFDNAAGYHVLELVERRPAGRHALEEVAPRIRERLEARAREEMVRERMREAAERVSAGASLDEVAADRGWEVRESGRFRRTDFVPGLGQASEAVGAAFGLAPGQTAGPLAAGDRVALVQLVERTPADREAFEARRAEFIQQLTLQRRQEYVSRWLQALREHSEVRDLREQLAAAAAAQQG